MNVLCILKYFSFSLCCCNVFGMDVSPVGKFMFFLCKKDKNGLFITSGATQLNSAYVAISQNTFNYDKRSWVNVLVYLKNKLKGISLRDDAKKELGVENLNEVPLDKIKICYIYVKKGAFFDQAVPKGGLTSRDISPGEYGDIENVITAVYSKMNKGGFGDDSIVDVYCYIETGTDNTRPSKTDSKGGGCCSCCKN